MTQTIRCHLVGECDGGDLGWPTRQQCREPRPTLGAVDPGIANDGERAGHEQAAQIAVALFADAAEPVLAPARVLLRVPARSRPRSCGLSERPWGQRHWRQERWPVSGQRRGIAASRLLVSCDRCQAMIHTVENSRICSLSRRSCSPQRCQTHPCNHGQPFVACMQLDNVKQLLDSLAADRSDDPELGKVSPDHIDHRGLLADEHHAACDAASDRSAARASWSRRTAYSPW